ncbi:MAG: hypothetical protein HOP16_18160, partial [Acidobacteria bacterium]|nr:hypothetical protein [Acidobacteriota bacterium]
VVGVAAGAAAQTPVQVAAPDEKGFQPNRDYLSLLPFEAFDTASNNLILRFTDLALPGNGGRSLRIERVFSNSTFGKGWRMGIAGVPMQVVERPGADRWLTEADLTVSPWDLEQERRKTPSFQTLEQGAIRTTYLVQPMYHPTTPLTQYNVLLSNFGIYDRVARILNQPDGTVATYCAEASGGCPGEGWLQQVTDAFGNTVTVTWVATEGAQARLASVTQDLGNGEVREITFGESDDPWIPGSMTYEGRTSEYGFVDGQLRTMTPPEGSGWAFEYKSAPGDLDDGKIEKVTTPQGGPSSMSGVSGFIRL